MRIPTQLLTTALFPAALLVGGLMLSSCASDDPRVEGDEWRIVLANPDSGTPDTLIVHHFRRLDGEWVERERRQGPNYQEITDFVREGAVPRITDIYRYRVEGPDTLTLTERLSNYSYHVDSTVWVNHEDGLYLEPETGIVFGIGTDFNVTLSGLNNARASTHHRLTSYMNRVCPIHYTVEDLEKDTPEIQNVREAVEDFREDDAELGMSYAETVEGMWGCNHDRRLYSAESGLEVRTFFSFRPEQDEVKVIHVFPAEYQIIRNFDRESGDNFMPLVREALLEDGHIATFPTETLIR